MRAYLLSDLRLRCQQRCDKENDPQISDAEWNRLISEMYGELYSIVEKAGMRYFESEQDITITGAVSYTLDPTHLATVLVEYSADTGATTVRTPLRRMAVQNRARWITQRGGTPRVYDLSAQSIAFYSVPTAGIVRHTFMPQAPDLSTVADSTSVDLVQADGEGFLMWGVAVKALGKSESDVQLAIAEREAARTRFATWCALRAFNESPRTFVDRGTDDIDGDSNGYPVEGSFWWGRQ